MVQATGYKVRGSKLGVRGTMRVDMKNAARILNGIEIAAEIKAEVAAEARSLAAMGVTPGLAVVLVGRMAASAIYVRSKVKASAELGIRSEMLTPKESETTEEMLPLIADLNDVDTRGLLEAVDLAKVVDGCHPVNAGRLENGEPGLRPCTPEGILEI